MNAGAGGQPVARFGPYELVESIGRGGMGEIFLAVLRRDGAFEKQLVIKRILPRLSHDSGFVRMFEREARVAALLNHQNIVQIFDFGREGDEYFIAMEYVDGTDLGSLLARLGPPPLPAAVGVLEGVARALDYAHRRRDQSGRALNLVHRDVSPGNVLLSREGEVKLTDFGLVTSHSGDFESEAGAIKGKYAYMSPEQTYGDPLDSTSDIFSWGIVAYELLTGRRPFRGNPVDVIGQIRDCDFEPVPAQDVPEALRELVHQCLCRHRDERPESAADLLRRLSRAAGDVSPRQATEALRAWVRQAPVPDRRASHQSGGQPERTLVGDEPIYARATFDPTDPSAPPAVRTAADVSGRGDDSEADRARPKGLSETLPVARPPSPATETPPAGGAPPSRAVGPADAVHPERAVGEPPELTEADRLEPSADLGEGGRLTPRAVLVSVVGLGLAAAILALAWPHTEGPTEPAASATPASRGTGATGSVEPLADAATEPEAETSPLMLSIKTRPPGAEVLLDGLSQGVSPVVLSGLDPERPVKLRFLLEGFYPEEQTVMPAALLADPSRATLRHYRVDLRPRPARVTIRTQPEQASVSWDDERLGPTPVTIEDVPPGVHRLRVEAEHHQPEARSVTLTPGQHEEIEVALPRLCQVQVRGEPEGARVSVDTGGEAPVICSAPCDDLWLLPGQIELTVSRAGFEPQRLTQDVRDDVVVRFDLAPEEHGYRLHWRSDDSVLRGTFRSSIRERGDRSDDPERGATVEQRILFNAPGRDLSGEVAAHFEMSGEDRALTADVFVRSPQWIDAEFADRPRQGCECFFDDVAVPPGTHRLVLYPGGGGGEPVVVELDVDRLD